MDKLSREEVIIDAVEKLKNSPYQATAVKVELEAQLNRSLSARDQCHCRSGWIRCQACYDRAERNGNNGRCVTCDGSGQRVIARSEFERTVDCTDCHDGMPKCENRKCDGGSERCNDCDGYGTREGNRTWSTAYCHDKMMEKLAEVGLAKKTKQHEVHGVRTVYEPIAPLVFASFYADGSVDSEFTFTIALDDPNNIMLLPKVIEIFTKFAKDNNHEIDVAGSGMHMSILNHPEGKYGSEYAHIQQGDERRYTNFKRAMSLLMPALFFLSSADDTSRPLRYRTPKVDQGEKYSAVYWVYGALEFRCFQTCYDNPEQILDNIVVMKNCMRYWRLQYKSSGVEKIVSSIKFGNDSSRSLKRFYTTIQHVELLDAGLKKLKPSYYSMKEIKEQRKFDVSKRTFSVLIKKAKEEAKVEYEEYEERERWFYEVAKKRREADEIERLMSSGSTLEEAQAHAISEAEDFAKGLEDRKLTVDKFISDRISTVSTGTRGSHTLSA